MTKPAITLNMITDECVKLEGVLDEMNELAEKLEGLARLKFVLETETIPGMMKDVGIDQVRLSSDDPKINGTVYSVDNVIKARVPTQNGIDRAKGADKKRLQEQRDACIKFLREDGSEHLIKSGMVIDTTRVGGNLTTSLKKSLEGRGFDVSETAETNTQQISAYVRGKFKEGEKLAKEGKEDEFP